MNVRRLRFVSYGVVTGLLVVSACGCAKRRSTMGAAPEVNPGPKVEAKAGARADELSERSRKFDETVQQLPGRTPEEHRRAMREVFTELSQILPLLYGPNPSGVFRQQLRVVESARTQLASGPQGLAIEPTVDTGLRAARDALAGLASQGYFDQAQVGKTIEQINASLEALDTSRGAMHQTAVAESVGLMSQAIRQMSEALTQRLDDGAVARTKPAAEEPAAEEPTAKAPAETDNAAPDAPKSDDAKADDAKPDAEKPDADKPDAAKPDATEPEPAKPEAADEKPDADAKEPAPGADAQKQDDSGAEGQADKPDRN